MPFAQLSTEEFLSRIVPADGYKIAAKLVTNSSAKKWHHQVRKTHGAQANIVEGFDQEGVDAYYAMASYNAPFITTTKNGVEKRRVRCKENVKLLKAFWLDLDVGEGQNKYPSQQAAITDFARWLSETGLPKPTFIVSSGTGCHIYYVIPEAIPPMIWEKVAAALQTTCIGYGLWADPACWDTSRVLRPIGTHNHKNGVKRQVQILRSYEDVDLKIFIERIYAANKSKNLQPTSLRQVVDADDPNRDLMRPAISIPSSAHRLAEKCPLMGWIRDTQGAECSEPLWHRYIGLLRFTVESPGIIHEWSQGHAEYSAEDTDTKIAANDSPGPTTCDEFRRLSPKHCDTCNYREQHSSPIRLGEFVPDAAPAPVVDTSDEASGFTTLPEPRPPWARLTGGGLGCFDLKSEQVVKFCEYDFYPIKRGRDAHFNTEIITFRCDKGKDGRSDLEMEAHSLSSPAAFQEWLLRNGLYLQPKGMSMLQNYTIDYIAELQRHTQANKLHVQFGWQEGFTKFLLGDRAYAADGSVTNCGTSSAVSDYVGWFTPTGSLDAWKQVAEVYTRPGHEAYAFASATSFGAILMPLLNYEGLVVSLVSPEGGQGKTTVQSFIASVWGNPKKLLAQKNDTMNSLLQKLAVYNNIPFGVDEVTNLFDKDLSEFIYAMTMGREKTRLGANAILKKSLCDNWATIMTLSSNQSIVNRLSQHAMNAEAEMLRIMEYTVKNPEIVSKAEADKLFPMLQANYGVAADPFLRYVTTHLDEVRELLKRVREEFDRKVDSRGKERFWSAGISCTLVGALLAKQLGLVDYNFKALFNFAISCVGGMRQEVGDAVLTPSTLLAMYLHEFVSNRLVLRADVDTRTLRTPEILTEPRGQLVYTIIENPGLLILDRTHFKQWAITHRADFNEIIRWMANTGMVLDSSKLRQLGKGTNIHSPKIPCIEIDTTNPHLSGIVMEIKQIPLMNEKKHA